MAKVLVLFVSLFLAKSALCHVGMSVSNYSATIDFASMNGQFPAVYPDDKFTALETSTEQKAGRDIVVYTIGRREYGDQLVANGNDRVTFATPRDVQQIFDYPDYPPGAIVTYVQITIEQESTGGRAYVIEGGIRQRHIVIGVEAYATRVFGYELFIFGIW